MEVGKTGDIKIVNTTSWAKKFARQNNLKVVRMDTWADNTKII